MKQHTCKYQIYLYCLFIRKEMHHCPSHVSIASVRPRSAFWFYIFTTWWQVTGLQNYIKVNFAINISAFLMVSIKTVFMFFTTKGQTLVRTEFKYNSYICLSGSSRCTCLSVTSVTCFNPVREKSRGHSIRKPRTTWKG